jgi:predicted dehydrogenase
MNNGNGSNRSDVSRREFGKRVGQIAAATALAGIVVPHVHAAGDSTIQLALVGCGGRGTGAASDALHAKGVSPRLVAMADAFKDRLDTSFKRLKAKESRIGELVDVAEDRKFLGFEAYKQAMDCLNKGDVVILATPLAFRAPMFEYAIKKGLNVFMEKPLSSDGFASRRILKANEEAMAKNLKVGVGLMSRHAKPLQELHQRIQDNEIGEIILMRGYRMAQATGMATFKSTPKPKDLTDLEFQIRRFHSFLWSGGGCYSDYNIHIIDHLCWMKNAWPVKAMSSGGRHYKAESDGTPFVDQNFDSYSTEFTFADGTKLLFDGRCMDGAYQEYHSFIHGTNGCAIGSTHGDCGAPSAIFKGLMPDNDKRIWQSTDHSVPYLNEWQDLMDAIVNDKPYNEVKRGVEASLVTSMGRASAHIGQEVTFEQMLNSEHVFAPNIDQITSLESPSPLPSDDKGRYPQPEPGQKKTEY